MVTPQGFHAVAGGTPRTLDDPIYDEASDEDEIQIDAFGVDEFMHDAHSGKSARSRVYREEAQRLRAGAAAADTESARRTLLEAAAELDALADLIDR